MEPRRRIPPFVVDPVHEIRKVRHRLLEAALGVHARGEAAWGDELVDLSRRLLQQSRVAPDLRRALSMERTTEALRLFAGLPVEFPQHVHRADQPVLVSGINLYSLRLR